MFTIKKRLFPFLGCIVLLMMGAAMLTDLETLIRKNNGSLKDYNTSLVENDYEDIDEGYYEITIDAVFECFATEGPSGNPDSWYYAVWLDDNSIAILVTDEEETAAELDRICDETWDYLNYETDTFTSDPLTLVVSAGSIYDDSDLAIMYKQDLENLGITDDNFYIRYAEISTRPVDDLMTTVIIGALVFLAGIVCTIGFLITIANDRKKRLSGFDESIIPAGYDYQPLTEQVTTSEAKRRITHPLIKAGYRSLIKKSVLCFVGIVICAAIPGSMLLYNMHYSATNGDSTDRLNITNLDSIANGKNNQAAQLEITQAPSLIYSYDDVNYYVVENESSFIAIMDSAQYSEAKNAINNDGVYTMIGYLEEPSSEVKNLLVDYFESKSGTAFDYAQYEATYGNYLFHVQSNYNGSGFPAERIRTNAIIFGMIALFLLWFGFDYLVRARLYLKRLRYLSDTSYAQMEKELDAPTVRRYPQNLFLTENYIVMLHSFSLFKNNSNLSSDSLFINYKDVTWMYPSNMSQYGRIVNSGVTVFNKTFGPVSILSLNTNDRNNAILNDVFRVIQQKNSNVIFGYTEENQNKMGA